MLESYLTLGNGRIEVRYVQGERGFAQDAYSAVSAVFPPIRDYFHLSESFPKVRVILVPDRSEYDRLVRDLLHVEIEVPSDPARIAQPQRTDMVVLSPSAYGDHSIYVYDPDDFRRLMAHELTHMVEEHLSPDVEANPRWWSEGLAVYLSEQWRCESDFRDPPMEGVSSRKIPSMRDIQASTKLAYQWGWTFVRFLEIAYGRDVVLKVVRECADRPHVVSGLSLLDWFPGGGLKKEWH